MTDAVIAMLVAFLQAEAAVVAAAPGGVWKDQRPAPATNETEEQRAAAHLVINTKGGPGTSTYSSQHYDVRLQITGIGEGTAGLNAVKLAVAKIREKDRARTWNLSGGGVSSMLVSSAPMPLPGGRNFRQKMVYPWAVDLTFSTYEAP